MAMVDQTQRPAQLRPDKRGGGGGSSTSDCRTDDKRPSASFLDTFPRAAEDGQAPDPVLETSLAMRKLSEAFELLFFLDKL
ncbi:unnamed protein product [Bursaphelenchus xylophilus]|uniref:(pine wood nematode) hypothetical protein n=1 Tax=Bursaphelenchus xylophilus TaxID=6326 RepID=A0A7I8WGG2_BURXY|nr:unnamed protein product [Bursaphelenchus xylophilus]CAG9111091.1 unnamed protein product [Bursaphelenchus xylophilus]